VLASPHIPAWRAPSRDGIRGGLGDRIFLQAAQQVVQGGPELRVLALPTRLGKVDDLDIRFDAVAFDQPASVGAELGELGDAGHAVIGQAMAAGQPDAGAGGALADERVVKFIEGKPLKKVIVVQRRLVNVVV